MLVHGRVLGGFQGWARADELKTAVRVTLERTEPKQRNREAEQRTTERAGHSGEGSSGASRTGEGGEERSSTSSMPEGCRAITSAPENARA